MMVTMKSGLSGLFLLLSGSVSALGSVVLKSYVYLPFHYTWREAQRFCRSSQHYTDLATIYTQSDTGKMHMSQYYAWIGLHKSEGNPLAHLSDWIWPNGQMNTLDAWSQDEPGNEDSCASVYYPARKFHGGSCGLSYCFFFCHELKHNAFTHTFIPQSKTWSEAQQYCRDKFLDLVTLEDHSALNSVVDSQDFPVWTGLHRNGNTWKWGTGQSEYRNWASQESRSNGDCVSISSVQKEMATQNCSARFPFICIRDNLVLVKENKTWEEALHHCRTLKFSHQPGVHYELVSVKPGEDHDYVMNKVKEANSEKVWAGLRFLAGHWLWVNSAKVLYSNLATCPLEGQHCGALSKNNTGTVETTDCLQKWNFLCYRS